MSDKDYYSFDEVLSDLRMEEDELKRLVSAGEIRAFRDADTMRFKAEDIERLRTDGGDAEEIVLGDDLDLDMDLELDDEPAGDVEELDLAAPATTPKARGGRSGSGTAGAPTRKTPRSKAGDEPEGTEGAGVVAALVFGALVLIFANFAAFGAVSGRSNQLTGFLSGMFE